MQARDSAIAVAAAAAAARAKSSLNLYSARELAFSSKDRNRQILALSGNAITLDIPRVYLYYVYTIRCGFFFARRYIYIVHIDPTYKPTQLTRIIRL